VQPGVLLVKLDGLVAKADTSAVAAAGLAAYRRIRG
jgi:hypothetical protein